MKILVVQLARLGDIYMTWPVLRALRRLYPAAEIHLLTRSRFEGAVEGLSAIDRHISMSTSSVLSPLIHKSPDIDKSMSVLNSFVDELRQEKYDWIINFTFSPASSFLVHALSHEGVKVSGYTRYSDGSLCLAGENSSYFYAQVGIGKANRVHLADIFAAMADIEYVDEDWCPPTLNVSSLILPERYIVLHVGASERQKSLTSTSWANTLSYVGQNGGLPIPVVLIGSSVEYNLAEEITRKTTGVQFVNIVGQTKMAELFSILKNAELLIGCDSAPIHMASLTDTPTFNVSVGDVNFWETGPKAALSFIYRVKDGTQLAPQRLGEILKMLLEGQVAQELIVRTGGIVSYSYSIEESFQQRFQWDLVKALYLGGTYPLAERMEILQAAHQLNEINSFAMEQIAVIPSKGLEFAGPLLDRAEEVIQNISQWVPDLSPLINWYQAEKICIGPGAIEEICAEAMDVHKRLARHLQVYIPHEALMAEEVGNG